MTVRSPFSAHRVLLLLGAFGVVGLVPTVSSGCASSEPECVRGSDCTTGACNANGRCVPAEESDATADGTVPETDASGIPDSEPPRDVIVPDGGCLPNKDFRILRDEVPLAAGLRATYKIARDVDVSTAGTPGANDTRSWDFSGDLTGDTLSLVETQKVSDKWFKDSFKTASYATKLSESSTLLGVFEISPTALKLQGVVSPEDTLTKTNMAYAPAVDILAFPLEQGKTWTTNATVSGLFNGVFTTYTEKYDSSVDAKGTLKTPLGTFTVLRVRTTLTKTVGVFVTTIRSFAWVTECYGTVATASSNDNETTPEFTRSSEVRRISP
jgi:hypothetical protein